MLLVFNYFMQTLSVIINIHIAFTSKRTNIYLWTFLFNVTNLAMYAITSNVEALIPYTLLTVRSWVYYYYQPRIQRTHRLFHVIPWIFIALHIMLAPFTLTHPWHIIPTFAPAFVCYYHWYSRNLQHIRLGNTTNETLWALYNNHLGLMISILARVVSITANVVAIFTHRHKHGEKIMGG